MLLGPEQHQPQRGLGLLFHMYPVEPAKNASARSSPKGPESYPVHYVVTRLRLNRESRKGYAGKPMSMKAVLKELNTFMVMQKHDPAFKNKKLRVVANGLDIHTITEMSDGAYLLHGRLEKTEKEALVICDYFVPMLLVEPSTEERPPIGFKVESKG
jgi:hypothetical protein